VGLLAGVWGGTVGCVIIGIGTALPDGDGEPVAGAGVNPGVGDALIPF